MPLLRTPWVSHYQPVVANGLGPGGFDAPGPGHRGGPVASHRGSGSRAANDNRSDESVHLVDQSLVEAGAQYLAAAFYDQVHCFPSAKVSQHFAQCHAAAGVIRYGHDLRTGLVQRADAGRGASSRV